MIIPPVCVEIQTSGNCNYDFLIFNIILHINHPLAIVNSLQYNSYISSMGILLKHAQVKTPANHPGEQRCIIPIKVRVADFLFEP